MAVMPAVGIDNAVYVLCKAGYVKSSGWWAAQMTAAVGSGVAKFY